MDSIKEQAMQVYGGRSLFASIPKADLEETLNDLIIWVAQVTERDIKNREGRKAAYIRDFLNPLDAQTWVNALAQVHELVDVQIASVLAPERTHSVWVKAIVIEKT